MLEPATNPYEVAGAFGYLAAAPLLLITLGAFCNLFSDRRIGPSVAALLIVGAIVIAGVMAINGWFDSAPQKMSLEQKTHIFDVDLVDGRTLTIEAADQEVALAAAKCFLDKGSMTECAGVKSVRWH